MGNVKLKNTQTVSDIASAMLLAIHNSIKICEPKKYSKDFDILCKQLFRYCKDNFQYIEEPNTMQTVKQINRIYKDMFGDCKHYSIYMATYLAANNYQCILRFISQNKFDKTVTHVYPIAVNGKNQIILDAVYGYYDSEPPYYHKKDILLIPKCHLKN